jgi:hypothetical protein
MHCRSWRPDSGIPRVPFALDPIVAKNPSLFAVDLLLGGIRYEYGFVVNDSRVLEEWLYAYPKKRRQEWFTRDAAREGEFAFSRLFPGENQLISALTRPNSLFLSTAAQNNHDALRPIYNWFSQRLEVIDKNSREFAELRAVQHCKDPLYRDGIVEILRVADLGLADVEVVEEQVSPQVHRRARLFFEDDPELLERMNNMPDTIPKVRLRHHTSSGAVSLPFEKESEGTRTLFSLAGPIAGVLANGGTLIVDELDRSLHPHLAMMIVKLFNDSSVSSNAQLIFNSHDTNLLDTSVLRRDQIWFAEKGDDGETRLFPLTDFRARKYENLVRGYLQGRFGAVPSVRTPDLRRVAEG